MELVSNSCFVTTSGTEDAHPGVQSPSVLGLQVPLEGPWHSGLPSWWSDMTSFIMSINFPKFSSLLVFWLGILGKVTGMQVRKTVHSQKSMRACVLELLPLDLLTRHTWFVHDLILIVQTLSYYFLIMNVNMTVDCLTLHIFTCIYI